MKFRFELKPDLPVLAWAARVSADDGIVHVVHGAWVEIREDGFVEGAWNGSFAEFRFDQAATLVGSGARITSDGVVFAGHSDLHERLYVIRRERALFVSPSLALVLAIADASLDPRQPHYYLDFVEAYRSGIRDPRKLLRLSDGVVAEMHDVCNLRVTGDLEIERVEKPWAPAPGSFEEYKTLMQETLDRVLHNADDPGRQHRFRPVCMISRGYDSVAVAALASNAGCREAVTYRQSGSAKGAANDDGSAIGDVLGYRTTVYERPSGDAVREGEEEFYLEPWGMDREMLPMEMQLAGSVLLSGRSTSGWEAGSGSRLGLPASSGLPNLERPITYTPGCALTDFRMRVGFLNFAVPSIGAIYAPTLLRLTLSPAMRPWSVGGKYDKPIPRRIAEEAGVPRHLFGYLKMGGPAGSPSARRRRVPWKRVFRRIAGAAPLRHVLPRSIRDRANPRWRTGTFEVQKTAAKLVERYRRAIEN